MTKECSDCGEKKEKTEFYKKSSSKDGLRSQCKICWKTRNNIYYKKNSKKIKNTVKKYREDNIESIREYDRKRSKKRSPELNRYYLSKKRAVIKKATPKWLSKEHYLEIKSIYKKCVEEGDDFNVDHIVPLNGKKVCGLHVPWNMQILKNTDNFKKSNKFDGTNDNETWKKEIK